MQVVKIVRWWCLLKRRVLMVDMTVSKVRFSMDLVSLLLHLVNMDTMDLVMMVSN